ncbi:proline-rich protein 23A-like [Hyaena hyaena]|uniref:proline-rich protein 23A-like n=1 Tax=Hyaena hyaena TaxID=95912 RepID=UPI00192467AA|nr:proline-rich protein 23A-like [Hyaena hyaena]
MGTRPRSPSAHPAPCPGPSCGEPGPAKRRRTEEPADLEGLEGPPAAGALTSVVVLADGCALQVPLDDVDLVLEPEPTSVLQVSVGEFTLLLVPEALVRSGGQGRSPAGLEPRACLHGPGHHVAVEQGFFRAPVPQMAPREEAHEEDADPEFPPPGTDPAARSVAGLRPCAGGMASPYLLGPVPEPRSWVPTPSPERRSSFRYFDLDVHLLEPFPSSPLQPLPPSPSPGPHVRPQRPPGPSRKARRRLFQE